MTDRDARYHALVADLEVARERRRSSFRADRPFRSASSSSSGRKPLTFTSIGPLGSRRPQAQSKPMTSFEFTPSVRESSPRVRGSSLGGGDPVVPAAPSDRGEDGMVTLHPAGWQPPHEVDPRSSALCAYCSERVPMAELVSHMRSLCPARPDLGADGGATQQRLAPQGTTPQALRAQAAQDVEAWLSEKGLAQLAPQFLAAGFDDLQYLLEGSRGDGMEVAEMGELLAAVGPLQRSERVHLKRALHPAVAAPGSWWDEDEGEGEDNLVVGGACSQNTRQEGRSEASSPQQQDDEVGAGVARWLETLNLGQYTGRVLAHGYTTLEHLLGGQQLRVEQIDRLVEDALMPPGHAMRFRQAVRHQQQQQQQQQQVYNRPCAHKICR